MREDLASALVNLGYHRQAIDKALDAAFAKASADQAAFEDLLRSALKELSRA
jgi:Holliday junction resolvasome RuvABC DNA-binding subunit